MKTVQNIVNYQNNRVDALIRQFKENNLSADRCRYWHAIEKVIIRDCPVSILYHKKDIHVLSERIRNIRLNRDYFLKDINLWYSVKSNE
ncbi:MAG: hypothetical protein GF313_16595 [Caldithrix sp.]|nr:hypothetical protein [Caldithrix sp.]